MTKTIKAGTYLFRENDRSRELYIIQSGKVKVFRTAGAKEIEIALLGKGAVLGEMALIDGKPRSASAKVVEDCSAIIIDADTFLTKIKGVPSWFMTIIKMVSQKIRAANKHLERMQFDKRGINIILLLQYYFCRAAAQSRQLDIQDMKKQLDQLLSVGQHRIVYILDFLEHHNLISLTADTLACIDLNTYNNYCSFLRGLVRKSFEKFAPAAEPLRKVLLGLEESVSPAAAANNKHITLSGEELEKIAAAAGCGPDSASILSSIENLHIATIKKSGQKSAESSPLAGCVLNIDFDALQRYSTFNRYAHMVPAS